MFEKLKEKLFKLDFNSLSDNERLNRDLVKLENEKGIFGRDQMEEYLKKNNISEELKNSHKFINLVNASIGLKCTCYQEEEFYESDFHDSSSPKEIDNREKYKFLLNLVNRDINKMVGREIEGILEQFNDVQEFKINKELQFEDGSIINPGTYFIIEELLSDVKNDFNYNIHFEKREENVYNRANGTGQGYCLSEKDLVEFSQLVKHHQKLNYTDKNMIEKKGEKHN